MLFLDDLERIVADRAGARAVAFLKLLVLVLACVDLVALVIELPVDVARRVRFLLVVVVHLPKSISRSAWSL